MNSQKSYVNKEKQTTAKNNKGKKSKIIIIVLFGVIFGIVLLSIIALSLFADKDQQDSDSDPTYIFYEADYDFDIMKDEKYLQLDRQIYFSNPETGVTVAINNDKIDDVPNDQKDYVALLCDFIKYAINGNSEDLNKLFSDEYVDAEGKLKMDFTMQQLYNIKITYVQTYSQVIDGETHVSYDYWLEYMIRKNNGTFRSDMGSDCSRKEYVRVTNREGDLGIDVLSPYKTTTQTQEIISNKEAIIIGFLAIITISAFIAVSASMFKKKK